MVFILFTLELHTTGIKTDKCVNPRNIKKGEIIDPIILSHCSKEILRYNEALNSVDLSGLSVSDVITFLRKIDEDISFSRYARFLIRRMASEWEMVRNAKNYRLAIQSLECFMNNDNILFSNITFVGFSAWMDICIILLLLT